MNVVSFLTKRVAPIRIRNRRQQDEAISTSVSVILLVCFLFSTSAWGQQGDERNEPDLFIKGFLTMPSLSMSVNGQGIEQAWLDPNRIWSMGMGVEWRELTGSVSVRMPTQVNDPDLFGKTHYFDVQLQFYGERLGMDSSIQSYKGFFLRDLSADCLRGESCSLRKDLQVQHAGMVFYYLIDPRWSMRAAFSPPGRQVANAGSWFVSGGFNLLAMNNNDAPLVDGLDPSIDGGRFYMASVAPGYGYTWVKKRWFITTAIYVGGGPMYVAYSNAEEDTPSDSEWKLALKAGAKLGAGYSGEIWQAGIHAHADSPVARIGGTDLQWIAQSLELYAGRRF